MQFLDQRTVNIIREKIRTHTCYINMSDCCSVLLPAPTILGRRFFLLLFVREFQEWQDKPGGRGEDSGDKYQRLETDDFE